MDEEKQKKKKRKKLQVSTDIDFRPVSSKAKIVLLIIGLLRHAKILQNFLSTVCTCPLTSPASGEMLFSNARYAATAESIWGTLPI